MPPLLIAAFLITALLYASVGFGGGSTYNALLVLSGADYRVMPLIALVCNVIVVCGGIWRFARTGDLSARRLLPFLAASVPAAWIGGRTPISETFFVGVLGGALLLSGIRLTFLKHGSEPETRHGSSRRIHPILSTSLGGAIGLVSGLVGIGGGIFLAPVLYFMRWGTPRQIAAASSLFILVNSFSGLAGQLMKLQDMALLAGAAPYWSLPIAVFIGGQAGSWLASYKLKPDLIRRLTALLILYVAARLLWRWTGMI
jgi:uncharacterized membrane protein YfcA